MLVAGPFLYLEAVDDSAISVRTVSGAEVAEYVPSLAALRIEVFREYPYLYEGNLEYESEYLLSYAKSANSVFVLVLDGDKVVGVSTGMPMVDADSDFRAPFAERGHAIEKVYYFGESVLRKTYRGLGIGARFMREREAFARGVEGMEYCAFCAVRRPEDHVLRPAGYRDLGGFWRRFGFVERPDLETSFSWKEIGEEKESRKVMRFWLKGIL
ncbi:hypothetical protein VDG1235_946 [Verrucomicrobiia bacterium DG1235]|nr:hypothetical protein VDG1235_946 [Verrucomicrobiae bacterium DG1235]